VTDEAGTAPSAAALLTGIVPPAKSYAAFIMADRPIAYWRLGEATGEVAYDYAGGFNGAYLNGATLTQPGALVDDPDTAAGFIADFQTKVETPFDAALNPGQFTIECWAKVTGGQGNYRSPLTSRAASPVSGYIFYATPADRWEHWTGIGGSWNTILGPPVEYDKWTHLLATYDGVTKRFYINGNEVGNNTSVFVPNGSRPLRIGAGATDDPIGNFFFHGDVDEVAVYGTALSPDRVLAHYGAGLGSTTPPTISVQPASRAVLPGTDVAFSVQASGSLPLSYQWYHNGALLPGETSATLALPSVQKPQEGKYQVTVRNTAGLATSDEATLTVVSVPDLAYQDAVLADGPVSYWRLDETSGEVAVDVMNKYPGAYLNGVTLGVPGAIVGDANPAAQFSAPSQTKVEVAFTPDLNPPQFTVEVWAKVTGGAGNYRSPLTSRADQPQRGYIFYAEPGNSWQFWSGKGDQTGWEVIAGPAIRLGSWTHLSATYDGATKRFYVDGMLAGTSTGLFGPNDENLLRIGGGASENPTGNYFFEGSVDEVAVYDKVLSPERILIHYALGARPTPPPTLQVAQSGNNVVLSWSAAGWVLQENTDLANAGGWQAVPGGTASPVTLSIGTGAKFYRLKKQ
ncbi:MAG: immunoglobulin domain-containing protein, partial [Chloroflexi bacterium]|nr:immunoglobulin domain-containing protein [Chloroflexota bacterium]